MENKKKKISIATVRTVAVVLMIFSSLMVFVIEPKVREWKSTTYNILQLIQSHAWSYDTWIEAQEVAKKVPSIYPLSSVHQTIEEMLFIFDEINVLKTIGQKFLINNSLETDGTMTIEYEDINTVLQSQNNIQKSLKDIIRHLKAPPDFTLNPQSLKEQARALELFGKAEKFLTDIDTLEKYITYFRKNNSRILLLLQNENEPRPTGGFSGSYLIVDFEDENINISLSDTYSIDRKVPSNALIPAPKFFHGLSQNISLRDANFWPDFSRSAKQYQKFFIAAKEKEPVVVMAVSLGVVKKILELTGPIDLQPWNIRVNQYNVDTVLSFLVEGKVSGRYQVKTPIINLWKAIAKEKSKKFTIESFFELELDDFWREKNILGYSSYSPIQKIFKRWKIDGNLDTADDADNVVYFDFISIGANKSEKFVWTKFNHNSKIDGSGRVINTLDIVRNHILRPQEISNIIGKLTPNLASLLTDELLWKLGAGQNRTILRILVPKNAKIISFYSPSGPVESHISEDKKFREFLVPLFVSPGEKLSAQVIYRTDITRGSLSWRPYHLQLIGTPARSKSKFLATISTSNNGNFTAETENIGLPNNLIDTSYRALAEFGKE